MCVEIKSGIREDFRSYSFHKQKITEAINLLPLLLHIRIYITLLMKDIVLFLQHFLQY